MSDLWDAIALFKEELTESLSMEPPIEESDKLIQISTQMLGILTQLSEDHRRAIHEMLGNKPPTLPKPPIENPSAGDASPDNPDQ